MSQQFPTSAQIIYEVLSTDTEFMSYIGTYRFKGNNSDLPAISIVTAGDDLPSVRRVRGLECVIQDAGNTSRRNYLTGDSSLVVEFSVFMICWEGASGAEMQSATEKALMRFGNSQAVQTVATPDGLGSLVQNKIIIRSDGPVLAG